MAHHDVRQKNMQQIRIRFCVIGQPPPDLNIGRIAEWKSRIWRVDGTPESFALSQNADLDSWGFSDELLAKIAPDNNGYDFTFCILNVPLEDNYYSRRLAGNVVCFSFYETAEILRHYNIPIENAVLRMAYSYSLIFRRSKGRIPETRDLVRFAHDEARGCIFDMNGIKTEIALSCDGPILCEACKASSLIDGVSREFIAIYEREIKGIRRELYYRLAGVIKCHPILTLTLSILLAIGVNLVSSYVYEKMNGKEPSKALEPMPMSVTNAAAQPPRQP